MSEFSYEQLSRRVEGLQRLKGRPFPLTIGYETTAMREGEGIAVSYRGTKFAIITSKSVTAWHNHSHLSQTFQRQLNRLLKPVDHVAVVRDGRAYLIEMSTERLIPFPVNETVTITPREGHTP